MIASDRKVIGAPPTRRCHHSRLITLLLLGLTLCNTASWANPQTSLNHAYQQQRALVTTQLLEGRQIAGFKAGLTSPGSQNQFGLKQPIAGVLLAPALLSTDKPIRRPTNGDSMMIETELAFLMGCTLKAPIKEITALQTCVSAVAPAIELPEISPELLGNLTANGLVSTNVGAARVILGEPQPPLFDLNALQIKLSDHSDQLLNQAEGRDALGDQWQALRWLVNQVLAQGWAIQPGQVLITGALGKPVMATPGAYQGDFGKLGKLSFTIK